MYQIQNNWHLEAHQFRSYLVTKLLNYSTRSSFALSHWTWYNEINVCAYNTNKRTIVNDVRVYTYVYCTHIYQPAYHPHHIRLALIRIKPIIFDANKKLSWAQCNRQITGVASNEEFAAVYDKRRGNNRIRCIAYKCTQIKNCEWIFIPAHILHAFQESQKERRRKRKREKLKNSVNESKTKFLYNLMNSRPIKKIVWNPEWPKKCSTACCNIYLMHT